MLENISAITTLLVNSNTGWYGSAAISQRLRLRQSFTCSVYDKI